MKTRLILGDCLEKMQDIESGSVDLILTDLPYGTVKGATFFRNAPNTSWDTTLNHKLLFEQFERILRKNGKAILFAQQPFTNELINNAPSNLPLSYSMVWDKLNFANCFISKKACVNYTEDMLLFKKTNPKNDKGELNEIRDYFEGERKKTNLTYKQINKDCFNSASNGGGMASNILTSYKKVGLFRLKNDMKHCKK